MPISTVVSATSTIMSATTTIMSSTSMSNVTTLDPEAKSDKQHTTDSQVLLLLLLLLFLTILVIWRFKVKRVKFLHETGVSLLIGFLVGYFVDRATPSSHHPAICDATLRASLPATANIEAEAVFDPEIFFYVLLPPIIFFAGYDLKQKHFFRNLGVILLFAFFGTCIVCFATGGLLLLYTTYFAESPLNANDCFAFGALISATDPVTVLAIFHDLHVDDRLYAMVFGESVLNDAVAIVLYRSIGEYRPDLGNNLDVARFFYSIWVFLLIFFGSFSIGILTAMVSSALFKFTDISRFPILETTMFVLLSYMSFLLGEGFGLSGIVSILFCGVGQAHYTYPCLSEEAKLRTKQFFELLNFLAENFIFSYIGINFFTYKCHKWDAPFISWSVFVVLITRVLHVFPLSWIANKFRKRNSKKITKKFQYMLWWSGLRGAIAFALAMRNTKTVAHQTILSTTLVVVLFTVVAFGGTTSTLISYLGIPHQSGGQLIEVDEEEEHRTAQPNKGWLAKRWQSIDKSFIRPCISFTDNNENMEGTDSLESILFTIKQFFLCRSSSVSRMSSIALNGDDEDNEDSGDTALNQQEGSDDEGSGDEDNFSTPFQDHDNSELSSDFTSFATWRHQQDSTNSTSNNVNNHTYNSVDNASTRSLSSQTGALID
eukprot:m.72641 g.72641  ORF g.72641 m.72641 type:complete len:658 (-) comp8391_c0_seq1:111-2084(-)